MAKQQLNPPTVYAIAGPNGAGKTTFASEFLPDFVKCREFLNADLIAAGLSPFAPEAQNVRAGRLLLERIRELAGERVDFGFETTLSGRTYVKRLTDMRASGFRVVLFFLWLPNVDMAVARVRKRVAEGGHGVPLDDIRRRYAAGIQNLFRLYRSLMNGGCTMHPDFHRGSSPWKSMDSWSSNRLSSSGGSKHKRRRFMKKATDDPLTKLADAAFRQAARKVIKRAKEAGTTVVVWEDGEIKEVDPRKIKNGRRKR